MASVIVQQMTVFNVRGSSGGTMAESSPHQNSPTPASPQSALVVETNSTFVKGALVECKTIHGTIIKGQVACFDDPLRVIAISK